MFSILREGYKNPSDAINTVKAVSKEHNGSILPDFVVVDICHIGDSSDSLFRFPCKESWKCSCTFVASMVPMKVVFY